MRKRRRGGSIGAEQRADELYWRFLAAAAGALYLGVLSLRERAAPLAPLPCPHEDTK